MPIYTEEELRQFHRFAEQLAAGNEVDDGDAALYAVQGLVSQNPDGRTWRLSVAGRRLIEQGPRPAPG